MDITIRAHHLLCTTEFSGHGYDEGFASHMECVVNLLHNGENHMVTLVDRPDLICSACPNLTRRGQDEPAFSSGRCRLDNNNVINKDRDVLDILGLEADFPYELSFLFAALGQNFDEDAFYRTCGTCGWFLQGLCSLDLLTANAEKYLGALC